jgi:tetratricopeptide (TPR) repeat protein
MSPAQAAQAAPSAQQTPAKRKRDKHGRKTIKQTPKLKDGSEIVKNHGRTAKEAERLEGEVKRVGGRYIDTRQYTARPRIMGKLKASLLGEAAVWAPLIFFWVPLIFLGFCLLSPISAESKVVSTEAECTVDRSVTGIQSISGLDPWHQLFSHLWSQVLLLLPSDASNQSNKHHKSVVESVGVGYIDTRQYTARPCIMGKLKAALLESAGAQRVAVVGQGGSGKSTLARWLLQDVGVSHKGASGVRLVFFVSGRDSGDVARGYKELMQPLSGLLGRPAPADSGSGKETEEVVRAFVHSALRDRDLKHRWVGVIDDLPSPSESALEEAGLSWLVATDAGGFPWGSGKTLVTSRFHGWKETFGGVGEVVGSFEEEEALALLADKVEHWRDQPAGIKEVAHRLAYFPVALASAAGCAKAFRLAPHEYLAELERSRSELLEDWNSRTKNAGEYPHEFFQVMHVTWQRLAEGQHAETVMELLRMLAFVHPIDIPITLFEQLRRHLPILTEHCLVTVSAAGERVSLHSLTQQVLREHLMGNTSNHSLAAATAQVRARMDEFDPNEVGTLDEFLLLEGATPPTPRPSCGTFAAGRRYAPHAKTVLSHADAPASPDVAHLALQLGRFYRDVVIEFDDARRMLERSLSVWRALGMAEESLEVANCYHALGVLCNKQGMHKEAVTHFERSLAIRLKVHGTEDHSEVAASLSSLGTVLFHQGSIAEAVTHFERSLAIRLKVHGTEEHPEVAASLGSLGQLLHKQGRDAEAVAHFKRSKAILIKVHGTVKDPDVAACISVKLQVLIFRHAKSHVHALGLFGLGRIES